MNRQSLTCVVVAGVLFGIVSCERLTLTEQPTETTETTPVHPNIRAIIDATLDEAMTAAESAAARQVAPDPAYATLRSVLGRARDANLARTSARNIDRASLAELTEEELKELAELVEKDPVLRAEIEALTEKLRAEYDAVPPIEVEVQPYDEEGNPVGESYVVASRNGVINFGFSAFSTWEFLLLVQAKQEHRPERGFAIESSWAHESWGSGNRWPNATVKYTFDHATLSPADRSWMTEAMARMTAGTGITFRRVNNVIDSFLHLICLSSNHLWISKRQLGAFDGQASVGKIGCSFLYMDIDLTDGARKEYVFNHEMGHVLGLLHEHQRYDRDRHVRVVPTDSDHRKIPERRRHCRIFGIFDCRTVRNTTHYGTPYDYHSVMHYRPKAGKITLNEERRRLWKRRNNNDDWGHVNGDTYFTPWDIYTIKILYGMSASRPTYTPVATPVDASR